MEGITEAELLDAANNLEWFAVRLKGMLALGAKAKILASLLASERQIRETVADLQQKAESHRATAAEAVARADAAQTRLDNIQAEIASHQAAIDDEHKSARERARADVERIIAEANSKAEQILAGARARMQVEAEEQAEAVSKFRSTLDKLNTEITAREARLSAINSAIATALEKIGAR